VKTSSKPGKKTVNLAPPKVPVSRIRRDPPPAVKEKLSLAPDERERWVVGIGVVTFALAVCVIIVALVSYAGWPAPWQYTMHVSASE